MAGTLRLDCIRGSNRMYTPCGAQSAGVSCPLPKPGQAVLRDRAEDSGSGKPGLNSGRTSAW